MKFNQSSTLTRVYLRASALVLFVICLPGLAHAQWTTSGSNVTTTSNVGIGTTDPGQKLQIGDNTTTSSLGVRLAPVGVNWDFLTDSGGNLQIANGNGNYLTFIKASTTSSFAGNVGIGTTSPSFPLHVAGNNNSFSSVIYNNNASGNGLFVSAGSDGNVALQVDNASQTSARAQFLSNGDAYLAMGTGNVGIGTTSPGVKLHVVGTTMSTVNVYSPIFNYDGGANLQNGTSGDLNLINLAAGNVKLYTSSVERIRIDSSGNVGIGKTNPAYKLEVDGTFHANGAITGTTINATYQDVAEWVPSTQRLSAGTVVVLDTSESNHVLASSSSYDTKVAGVISAQPGIALGTGGEDKVLVATTGRVKVKVDATTAPIHVGDLLVTSDNEGVAMRSDPIVIGGRRLHAPGTIVGKALEPLEKGTGEILVLLSLQ